MTKILITSLPLGNEDRIAFVESANRVFENVMKRMELREDHPVRKLWSVESYVSTLIDVDMLPIERDYAISLIDAFLIHHVLDLLAQLTPSAGARTH